MPRERTAEDRLLALLALVPAPVGSRMIGRTLGWSRPHVASVLLRLVHAERITAIPGKPAAEAGRGRPPATFWLAGRPMPEEVGKPLWPWFDPDTVVVTPSDREARVVCMLAGGFAELVFLDEPDGEPTPVHASLLRPFQPGRERPEPARVTA